MFAADDRLGLKKQYKNAPKEGKNSIQKEIELNQNILKAMKEQKKLKLHNTI